MKILYLANKVSNQGTNVRRTKAAKMRMFFSAVGSHAAII